MDAQKIRSLDTYLLWLYSIKILFSLYLFSTSRGVQLEYFAQVSDIFWYARYRELNRKYFTLVLVVVYLVVTGCAELMFCFLFWHGVRNWIKLARVVRELFNRFD